MSNKYRDRNWYIRTINVAKRQLDLDENVYRDNLRAATGKESLRMMNLPELYTALDRFKSLGFKLQAKTNKKYSPKSSEKPEHKKNDLDKLRQLWIEMHKQGFLTDGSEQALEKWAITQSKRFNQGKQVERLVWTSNYMRYHLIEQLKQWHKRLLNSALPIAYEKAVDLAKTDKLSSQQKTDVIAWQDRLNEAPETHQVISGMYRCLLDILAEHGSK